MTRILRVGGGWTMRSIRRSRAIFVSRALMVVSMFALAVGAPPPTRFVMHASSAGLVAAYGFGEGTGSVTLDSSGNQNNGTITSATWTTAGRFGNALTFSGNGYVTVGATPSLDLGGAMTLEAWVRPTSNFSGRKTIVMREISGNLAYALYGTDGSSHPAGFIRIGTSSSSAAALSSLGKNTWTHVASTYDGTVIRLYLNGVQAGSTAVTGTIVTSTWPLRIGGNLIWGEYFRGQIDEVRIYNRALSTSDIQLDMSTPVPAVDTTAPTVSMTAPANNATLSGIASLSANASDNVGVAGVQFLLDGAPLGSEVLSPPYAINWDTTTTTDATHALTARARDAAGNATLSVSVSVGVSNVPDTTPPSITAIASSVTTNAATITWTTDEPADSQVDYGLTSGYGSTSPLYPTLVTTHTVGLSGLSSGTAYHYRAVSEDAAGNLARSGDFTFVTGTTDNIPPSVTVTSPASGSTVTGTLSVTATASDNVGVAGVTFMLDGAAIGGEVQNPPYATVWNTVQAANGAHTLTARARDAAGNVATSAPIGVTVSNSDTVPPIVAITAPSNGATVALVTSITANASDNVAVAGIQFALDGVNIWQEDTLAPYAVSWDTASTANGLHTLTARARDTSGNLTTSSAVSVTVSNSGSKNLTIDGSQIFQTIDGFGVNANSLSWKGGELKPALDLLVDQLGATLWRVVFDMEDWEVPNDNGDPSSFDWNYYNALYSNSKFQNLWGTLGYLNQKGVASNIVLSFMGRVPNWMGGDHINATAEDEWVETMASLMYYARVTKGVHFGALDPLNEPDWDGIEGPRVDQWQYTGLLHKLSQKLDALGLSDIRLIGPNTASIDTGTNNDMPTMMGDTVVMDKVDHFGFHNYAGYTAGADNKIKTSAYPTKNFWITEVTNPWDIMTHIGQGPAGVLVWDAYDSVYNHAILAGRGSTAPNDAGNGPAPLAYNSTTGTYIPRKGFYEDAQIFKFVPPGSVRIGAAQQASSVVLYAFWHQASGRVTVVARNSGGSSVVFSSTLRNLPAISSFHLYQTHEIDSTINFRQGNDVIVAGNSFSYTLPAYSWVTLTAGVSDPTPPTVGMTSPTAGATVSGTVIVAASASDNVAVGGVQFKLDGANLGAEVTVAPYRADWNTTAAANGNHTVWAAARDTAGNVTTSSSVAVTVNNVDVIPPTVSLTQPLNGSTVSGIVTVSANAADDTTVVGVQFLLDGAALGSGDFSAPYSIGWSTVAAASGSHTLSAVAYDGAGNATTSTPVTVTVSNDVTPPTVSVTAPADQTTVSGNVTVAATANDNSSIAGVQFLLDGNPLNGEVTIAPYTTTWATTTTVNGAHVLAARARDAAGNTATSASVTVNVSNAQVAALVAAYGLSEGSGSTTADTSPTANTGNNIGATWTAAGKYGSALSFNGSSSYLDLTKTDVFDGLTDGTIEAWVKWSGSGYDTWFSADSGACLSPFELAINSGRFEIWADGSGCAGKFNVSVALTNPTAWHHLAYVVSSSGNKLYVDAIEQVPSYSIGSASTRFFFANAAAGTTHYNIGRSVNTPAETFGGLIDELRIYNRALSQAEIQTDMNTPIQ